MNRVEQFEKAFKKRYGKDAEVFSEIVKDGNVVKQAVIKIISSVGTYMVIEHFKEDNKTDFVESGEENNLRKYKTYLEAEIYVADLIGEKENGNT